MKKITTYLMVAFILFVHTTASATEIYKIMPGNAIVLTNITDHPISASCIINAVSTVVNSISINMVRGNGMFNGTTLSQGQTLFQNVYNTQFIPIAAISGASAIFTNLGSYTVQAQCDLN